MWCRTHRLTWPAPLRLAYECLLNSTVYLEICAKTVLIGGPVQKLEALIEMSLLRYRWRWAATLSVALLPIVADIPEYSCLPEQALAKKRLQASDPLDNII